MRPEKILRTMGDIDPEYIDSAEKLGESSAKRRLFGWLAAAAAALAALGLFFAVRGIVKDNKSDDKEAQTMTEAPTAKPTEEPKEGADVQYTAIPTEAQTVTNMTERQKRIYDGAVAAAYLPEVPHSVNDRNYFEYMRELRHSVFSAGDDLEGFFGDTVREFLLEGEEGENTAYSPLNVYMALAMLAETASGETRQQILDLIGANSMEDLRAQINAVWLANYHDSDIVVSLPAASAWLNSAFAGRMNKEVVNRLAELHHASVFEGDMDDPAYTGLFRDWLNEQTRDLLTDSVSQKEFMPIELLHIAATLYYKIGWASEFIADNNTEEAFHAPTGDETVTFMHGAADACYEGEDYFMAFKTLSENARVWFILPNEGVELENVIEEGDALGVILAGVDDMLDYSSIIRLHMPKFDVSSDLDLRNGLKKLGVTDCFDAERSDFSEFTDVDGVYVSEINHSVRVTVDEKGVEAAAMVDIGMAGGMPPERIIDFTIDRPFMFVITGFDGTPLFVGTVYHPAA